MSQELHKFKVGDKVVLRNTGDSFNNRTGTIQEIDLINEYRYKVSFVDLQDYTWLHTVVEVAGNRVYYIFNGWKTWVHVKDIRRATKLDKALK